MPTTLVSWNLKGSANPDTAAVAEHIRSEGADLVALQEVQWHQARRIARALGATSRRWSFKHFPGRTWPEGMAVIGVTVPVHARTRGPVARLAGVELAAPHRAAGDGRRRPRARSPWSTCT